QLTGHEYRAGVGANCIDDDVGIGPPGEITASAVGVDDYGGPLAGIRRDHRSNPDEGIPCAVDDAAKTGTGPLAATPTHVHRPRAAETTLAPHVETVEGSKDAGVEDRVLVGKHPGTPGGGDHRRVETRRD